jgi:REP element-mobilizing transposase RayT
MFLTGKATKTDERRSVAHQPHDQQRRRMQEEMLKYEPVEFTGAQALAVVHGFQRAVDESYYLLHALSVMPRHVHGVVARHAHPAERIIGHLKGRAAQQLLAEGLHPFAEFRDARGQLPSVWAHRAWKVFLHSKQDVVRAVDYVKKNPTKEGLKAQDWKIVTPA